MSTAQNASLNWAARMGGTLSDDSRSLTVDASGNVYIAGNFKGTSDFDPGTSTYSLQSAGGSDAFISTLDASGNFVWAKRLGGTSDEVMIDLATDAAGNIYSTGNFSGTVDFDPGASAYTMSAQGTKDIFISKLDAAGNFVWAKQLGATGGTISGGSYITLDPSGNLHIAATFDGTIDLDPGPGTYTISSGGNASACITTLDAAGSFIRAEHYTCSSYMYLRNIASDASGNIYSSGIFAGIADFDAGPGTYTLSPGGSLSDLFLLKTTAAGNMVWVQHIGGGDFISPTAMTIDPQQNVYSTGIFTGSIDFDPGPGSYSLSSSSTSGHVDNYILKLDAAGNFSRAQILGDPVYNCYAQDIATDAAGALYMTGNYNGTINFDPGVSNSTLTSNGNNDVFLLVSNASGDLALLQGIGGTGSDISSSMAVDASGHVYTTGVFEGSCDFDPGTGVSMLTSAGQQDVFIQKLNKVVTGLKTTDASGGIRLYPNPASHFLKLEITHSDLASALKSPAVAELVNTLGQVVLREQIGEEDLSLDIGMLSAGVYAVRISRENVLLLNQKIIKE